MSALDPMGKTRASDPVSEQMTTPTDQRLALLLEAELSDYMHDEPDGWVRQAAQQVVAAVRLAGWLPVPTALMPAEVHPAGRACCASCADDDCPNEREAGR